MQIGKRTQVVIDYTVLYLPKNMRCSSVCGSPSSSWASVGRQKKPLTIGDSPLAKTTVSPVRLERYLVTGKIPFRVSFKKKKMLIASKNSPFHGLMPHLKRCWLFLVRGSFILYSFYDQLDPHFSRFEIDCLEPVSVKRIAQGRASRRVSEAA